MFYEFLESINLTSDQKHFLLLDNARIHFAPQKGKEENLPTIKEQLAKKNIEPLYLVLILRNLIQLNYASILKRIDRGIWKN